jgi:hypothetical protein
VRLASSFLLTLLTIQSALPADAPEKKMESDRPMSTKMMKPGMKQRDVKREADKKAREMEPMLKKGERPAEKGG